MSRRITRAASLCAIAVGATISLSSPTRAAAQELNVTTVATVNAFPTGKLLSDHNAIYGATLAGAVFTSDLDFGTIFAIPNVAGTDRTLRTLYSFNGTDGAKPNGGLIADAQGNLYGTTQAGGAFGFGTVFELLFNGVTLQQNPWPIKILHSFTGGADGSTPLTGLTFGPDGSVYGTTSTGGLVGGRCAATGCGTFFKITSGGAFATVHSFTGDLNGDTPQTNLAVDPQGVVIGAVEVSVSGAGGSRPYHNQLVAITAAGALKVVATFPGSQLIVGDIVRDSAGNVYGAGRENGSIPSIWKVSAQTHVEGDIALGPESNGGVANGVFRDNAGNLYVTTRGTNRLNGGLVTALLASQAQGSTMTTLATLGLNNNGPLGDVILDPTGTIWGTSSAGGGQCSSAQNVTPSGCGTVFTLTH